MIFASSSTTGGATVSTGAFASTLYPLPVPVLVPVGTRHFAEAPGKYAGHLVGVAVLTFLQVDSPPQAPDGAGDSPVHTGVECFYFFVILFWSLLRVRRLFSAYVREWVRSPVTF